MSPFKIIKQTGPLDYLLESTLGHRVVVHYNHIEPMFVRPGTTYLAGPRVTQSQELFIPPEVVNTYETRNIAKASAIFSETKSQAR